MWFFVDETWSPDEFEQKFGILFGVLVLEEQLTRLDDFLYSVKKKYYGKDHAKNLENDLKGKKLISNYILNQYELGRELPRNLCVVKEILSFPLRNEDVYLKVFASTIFREDGKKPLLLSNDAKSLARPFKEMIENVSFAAAELRAHAKVNLVFDERMGAQQGIAIAIKNFVAGMGLSNISPYPYFAVSNVSPGIQIADVMAHLLSKKIQKGKKLDLFYRDLIRLQWERCGTPKRFGFNRYDEKEGAGGSLIYTMRKKWAS